MKFILFWQDPSDEVARELNQLLHEHSEIVKHIHQLEKLTCSDDEDVKNDDDDDDGGSGETGWGLLKVKDYIWNDATAGVYG